MTEKDPDDRFPDAAAAVGGVRGSRARVHRPALAPRRDARAGSSIDISGLPEPGATPPHRKQPSSQPIATTGYQTYQATAALYEVLEGDPDAAQAVVTPPPRPAAQPATRRTAPQPVAVAPAAAGGPPATATPTGEDEPDAEPHKPLPVGLITMAAIVVAVVAFVVGMSSKKSDPPATASGDGFVLKAPAGWKPAPAGSIASLGTSSATLAPPGAGAGEGIAGARLPNTRYAGLAGRGEPTRVKLNAGEAVRIAAGVATLFALSLIHI